HSPAPAWPGAPARCEDLARFPMGPRLMTGLACFGAAVAIGVVASSQARAQDPAEAKAGRRLAIILIAFAMGSGVLGVVIGLVAIFFGEVRDPTSGLPAGVPAILGAIIGLGLVARHAGETDRWTSIIGAIEIVAVAMLGIVVASLAVLIAEIGRPPPPDWPFVILGVATATSAIGLARTGRAALRVLPGTSDVQAKAIVRR